MSNMTEWTSPAVGEGTYDSTPIDRLATHKIIDGRVVCNRKLSPIFGPKGDNGPITCKRCSRPGDPQ